MLQQTLKTVVVATQNPGKLAEFQELLAPLCIEVFPLSDFTQESPCEIGLSFLENALIKARFACLMTGLPALADDSGLVVDALNGRPGIFSARYAAQESTAAQNIKKLCEDLKDVPDEARGAYFYSCLVLLEHENDPVPTIGEGIWHGRILRAPVGSYGFGYDPIFFDESIERVASDLLPQEKNARSHRGQAFRALLEKLSR
jgi:XTP/dITP diphosphohydrolase